MVWNHRVIRVPAKFSDDGYYYAIHECFYTSKRHKVPHSWTESAIHVGCNSPEGILWVLQKMKEAVAKPILEIDGKKLREVPTKPKTK